MATGTVAGKPRLDMYKTKEVSRTVSVEETYTRVRDVLQFSETSSIYGQGITLGSGTRMGVGVPIWFGADKGNFTFNFAVSLGAPIDKATTKVIVRRMWFDEELVLDRSNTGSSLPIKKKIRFVTYPGSETQTVDPSIAREAGGIAPAFRGQIYIVIKDLNLKDHGLSSIPVIRVEFEEKSQLQPTYKEFAIPSRATNAPAFRSTNTVFVKGKNRVSEFYTTDVGVAGPLYAAQWNTKTGALTRDVEIRRRDGSKLNIKMATTSYAYYHPVMDRYLVLVNQPNLYGNCYIINMETGTVDDIVGLRPEDSEYDKYLASRSEADLQEIRPVDAVMNEVPADAFPSVWNSGQKNWLTNLGWGVQTRIAFCTDSDQPPAEKTFKGLSGTLNMDTTGMSITDVFKLLGYTYTPAQFTDVKRPYASFSMYMGDPYYNSTYHDVSVDKIRINGNFVWMVTHVNSYDTVDGVYSATCPDHKTTIYGSDNKLYMSSKKVGTVERLHTEIPLAYPGYNLNYVSYADATKTFLCLHYNVSTSRAVNRAYRITLSTTQGESVFVSEQNINDLYDVGLPLPTSTFGYQPTFISTYSVVNVWDNNTESIVGGVYQPIQHYDFQTLTSGEFGFTYRYGSDRYLVSGVHSGYEEFTTVARAVNEDDALLEANPYVSIIQMTAVDPLTETFYQHMVYAGNNLTPIPLRRYSPYGVNQLAELSKYLRDLAKFIGFADTDIITTGITDLYWGSIITSTTDFWQLVNDLSVVYGFEVFESQGKIKFVKNAISEVKPIDYALTQDDVAPIQSSDFGRQADSDPSLLVTRRGDSDMPNIIKLQFIDYNDEYRSSQVYANRQNYTGSTDVSSNEYTMSIPICMAIKEAVGRANNILFDAWNDRITYQVRLPKTYMLVEPGDFLSYTGATTIYEYDSLGAVTITTQNTSLVIKTTSCTLNADWSTTLGGTSYYKSSVPTVTQEPPITPEEDRIYEENPVSPVFLDLTLLSPNEIVEEYDGNNDNLIQMFSVDIENSSQFRGTYLYQIVGSTQEILGFINTPPSSGTLINNLKPTMAAFAIHEDSLEVYFGEYTQAAFPLPTYAEFLSGTYLLAIQHGKLWEVVSYRDVTFNGESVVFSGLIRGRRGTEAAATREAYSGSQVILLDGNHGVLKVFNSSFYRQNVTIASVPPRATSNEIKVVSGPLRGLRHRPFAPTNIKVANAVDGVDISWVRRSRGVSTLNNGVPIDPPYVKEVQEYVVSVYANFTDTNPAITKTVVGVETVNITDAELTTASLDGQTKLIVGVAQKPSKLFIEEGIQSILQNYDIV